MVTCIKITIHFRSSQEADVLRRVFRQRSKQLVRMVDLWPKLVVHLYQDMADREWESLVFDIMQEMVGDDQHV